MRAALDVPRGGPFFEGHFPGRPILPGIALLDLALRALDPTRGPERLVRLDLLRLRRMVLPGEHLEIEAESTRLIVRRGEDIVAQAALVTGDQVPLAATRGAAGVPVGMDLDRLLPHRPPMRLVTGIEAVRDDGVVCAARLADPGPFTVDGRAPALAAIEMAAQAAAVFAGIRASKNDEGQAGYLVGARDVRFHLARIRAGAVCTAAVRAAGGAAGLSTFEFDVACGGESVAQGTLSTWLTPTGA